jgi:hypothetical protein
MDNPIDTRMARAELRVGTRVDVRTRYELGRWAPGFTIAEVRSDGFRIRRASDGAVLNETIHADELRVVSPPPSETQLPDRAKSDAPRQSSLTPQIGMNQ